MIETVCVYCSSSNRVDAKYVAVAEALGRALARHGYRLVYGGGSVGLMGVVARAVHAAGGEVCGVIPESLKAREGVAYDAADELITTETMQERKAHMYTRANAFVVLPGGFGTLEEFMEVLTLRQLRYHDKPIVLLNAEGFYDPLLAYFEHLYRERFAARKRSMLYHVARHPEGALKYIASCGEEGVPQDTSGLTRSETR